MPRVLSAAEFAGTESGIGWLENRFEWDEKHLERFAWVKHTAVGEDGCYMVEQLMEMYKNEFSEWLRRQVVAGKYPRIEYNRTWRCLFWEPDESQRRSTKWA